MKLETSESSIAAARKAEVPLRSEAEFEVNGEGPQARRLTDWETILYFVIFAVLSLLLVAPIWVVQYLPLGDLPDHAGQIRAMIDFDHYRANHIINWYTPYILAYALTMTLAKFLPLIIAIKMILTFCVLSIPVAMAKLIEQLRGDRFWVISAFPIAYGYSFYWGFYSCFLATALTMHFLPFVVSSTKRPANYKTLLQTAIFSLLIFCAHPIPWLFSACATFLIHFMHHDFRKSLRKSIPVFSTFVAAIAWMAMNNPVTRNAEQRQFSFGLIVAKIMKAGKSLLEVRTEELERNSLSFRTEELFTFSIGRNVSLLFVAISLYLLIWPIFFRGQIRFERRRWLPLCLVVAASHFVPFHIFDTYSVYCRFAVFLLPATLFVFARNPRTSLPARTSKERAFRLGAFSAALLASSLLLLDNFRILHSFKSKEDDFRLVLGSMLPGKLVLSLNFDERSALPLGSPYAHFANWYQAEKLGNVLYNFANDKEAPNVPLRYIGPPRPIPPIWQPGDFRWRKHHAYNYDYFLIHSLRSRDELFEESNGSVILLARSGRWYLYGKSRLKPEPGP